MSEQISISGITPENLSLIERDFISGIMTRKEICEKYKELGLTPMRLRDISEKLKWVSIRVQSAEIVQEKVKEKVAEIVENVIEENEVNLEEFIASDMQFNKRKYESLNKIQDIVDEIIDNKAQVFSLSNGTKRTVPLSIDDISKLTSTIINIQNGQRVALGLDKKKDDKNGGLIQNNSVNFFGDIGHEVREAVIKKASANFEAINKLIEENISE